EFLKLPATTVITEHSDYRHLIDEFPQVPRNVGRASGVERFSSHLHDRDGCLRRNAADLSPDKFVKHQIADDGDSPRNRALKDLLKPTEIHDGLRVGHRSFKSLADSRLE